MGECSVVVRVILVKAEGFFAIVVIEHFVTQNLAIVIKFFYFGSIWWYLPPANRCEAYPCKWIILSTHWLPFIWFIVYNIVIEEVFYSAIKITDRNFDLVWAAGLEVVLFFLATKFILSWVKFSVIYGNCAFVVLEYFYIVKTNFAFSWLKIFPDHCLVGLVANRWLF